MKRLDKSVGRRKWDSEAAMHIVRLRNEGGEKYQNDWQMI